MVKGEWGPLLGFRDDIDLNERWWHRLAKVVYFAVLGLSGLILVWIIYTSESSLPAKSDYITIKTSLGQALRTTDESVPNVIPAFLLYPGKIGKRNDAEEKVDSVVDFYVEKSWCTPNVYKHLEENGSIPQCEGELNSVYSGVSTGQHPVESQDRFC